MNKALKSIVKVGAFMIFETALLSVALFPTSNALLNFIGSGYTIWHKLQIVMLVCAFISCLTLLLPLFVKAAKEIVLNEEEEVE